MLTQLEELAGKAQCRYLDKYRLFIAVAAVRRAPCIPYLHRANNGPPLRRGHQKRVTIVPASRRVVSNLEVDCTSHTPKG